jgi:hypothetical protein
MVDDLHRLQIRDEEVFVRTHRHHGLLAIYFCQRCADDFFALARLHLEVALLLFVDDHVGVFCVVLGSWDDVRKFAVDFRTETLLNPPVAGRLLRNVHDHLIGVHKPALAFLVVVAICSILAGDLDLVAAVVHVGLLALSMLLHLVWLLLKLVWVVVDVVDDLLQIDP